VFEGTHAVFSAIAEGSAKIAVILTGLGVAGILLLLIAAAAVIRNRSGGVTVMKSKPTKMDREQ
jgi:hypothetical protein